MPDQPHFSRTEIENELKQNNFNRAGYELAFDSKNMSPKDFKKLCDDMQSDSAIANSGLPPLIVTDDSNNNIADVTAKGGAWGVGIANLAGANLFSYDLYNSTNNNNTELHLQNQMSDGLQTLLRLGGKGDPAIVPDEAYGTVK
ncbi:hypothetical protein BH10CYA1_BH10CYA1_18460 [soil metagenome]